MTFKKILICSLILSIGLPVVSAQDAIIKTGDKWQYYDGADAPVEGWETQTGATDDWKIGLSPLGYGKDSVVTNISFGKDSTNKHIVKYFKKTFILKSPFEHLVYRLNVQRDDGIVVYLNGYEVMRDNMPPGLIDNSTQAASLIFSSDLANQVHTELLSPDDFKQGVNTISASVHQARPTSSDCLFNLELIGDDNTEMIPILLRENTIKNLNLDIRIKELTHEQELEKMDLQLGFLEESKNNFRTTVYILSFLFLFTLCLLGYLFWFYRKRRNKLSETIANLKEIIIGKDRKLMSSSLNTVHNQQFLKELKDTLEDTTSSTEATLKKEINRAIRKIDYNLDNDEEWMNLLNHFNSIHVGFTERLIMLHPSLTETEQRHCIFIKLHMQTKEIAQILHIDPRSVQASRYRLKKKMELGENIDLRDYVLKL